MTSIEMVWNGVLDILSSSAIENNKINSIMPFVKESKLVELNELRAIITTPLTINQILLSDNIDIINDSFEKYLGRKIFCSIELDDEYQKNKIEDIITKDLNDNLIPDLTFENFVVGPSNIEARTAALYCAKNLGERSINPLVLYGDSGLGKTHLLSAIGNYVKEHDPDKRILYISSMTFVNDVISAIKNKTIEEYKSQLNSLDLLLVDDIQSLSGKEKTNEVFFSIYNQLFNNRKQVVLTSDRPPVEIKDIEDRLKTRFAQGLSVTIKPLENDTAFRILQMKIKNLNIDHSSIDEDVLRYIATDFSSDVRSLEGALNRLFFYSINFSKSDHIDLDLAYEAFKGQSTVVKENKVLDIAAIIKAVSNYYGLTEKQIISKTRTKNIANARHIAMYLCRKLLDESYVKIGEAFGKRDHSTVLSAYEKVDNLTRSDSVYLKVIEELEKTLK